MESQNAFENQLKKINDLFSRSVDVSHNINILYDVTISEATRLSDSVVTVFKDNVLDESSTQNVIESSPIIDYQPSKSRSLSYFLKGPHIPCVQNESDFEFNPTIDLEPAQCESLSYFRKGELESNPKTDFEPAKSGSLSYFWSHEPSAQHASETNPPIPLCDSKLHDTIYAVEPKVGLTGFETAGFGSPDDTELNVDVDIEDLITDPAVESTNVNVTKNDVSDELVVRENVSKAKIPWTVNVKPNQGCDDTNMFVPTSDCKTKKYCCVFCLNRYTKLPRHLQTAHNTDPDVNQFCSLPTGSKTRRKIIGVIRKRGQFKWNSDAKLNGGELSTCRRPNKKFGRKAKDFSACPKCLGSLAGKTLRKHFNECSNNALKGERIVPELSRAVEGRIHSNASDDLRKIIFPKMRANPNVQLIRFDWLLIEFANDLCLNYHPVYQHKMIRDKLQVAGKVLVALKSISTEITDFSSLFHVKHSNAVIEAVRKVSGFDLKAKCFGSPGTATTLVTLIKAIGDLLVIESMKVDDAVQERNVERFLKVFTKDVKLKINKLAALTQKNRKRHKVDDMPSTNDVNRLALYLDSARDRCFVELSEKYSYQKWQYLSELTLASVLVFNRRRTGEMRNIEVKEFEAREFLAGYRDKLLNNVIPESISQLIKSRIIVRGKLGNDVPVLLNPLT